MKKFIASLILTLAGVFPAVAFDRGEFFRYDSATWEVFGTDGIQDSLNPACILEYEWRDGSVFQLVYDLADGELYIWFRNLEWNIQDAINSTYFLDMIIIGNQPGVSSRLEYVLLNKNTIYIPEIKPQRDFVQIMQAQQELRLIMPGNISNAYVDLTGSHRAGDAFVRCISVGLDTNFGYHPRYR